MRNLDHLPSVLLDLSRHPSVSHLLNQKPTVLESYLRSQGWPEDLQEDAQPDSQEAQELAEMTTLVENWLWTRTPRQRTTLEVALEAVAPGASGALRAMMPIPA